MTESQSDRAAPAIAMRAVSEEEIAFLFDHGWVKLPRLIDQATATALLGRAQRLLGDDGRRGIENEAKATESYETWFRSVPDGGGDELFQALRTSEELGRNAARMLCRDSSIRMMMNSVMAKLPNDRAKGSSTYFHQDTPGHMYLEANFLTTWIALDHVTAEMGAMQFYAGSHKLGNLGQFKDLWQDWGPLLERTTSLTDPVCLAPGDATVHLNGTIHGTGPNLGTRPRWSWAGVTVPGDARYTGAKNGYLDGLGLEPYGMIEHPKFPVIYRPAP